MRRLFLFLAAASLPVLGGVLAPAHGDTGDTADAGTACFPWNEEDGDCPDEEVASKRLSNRDEACETEATSWGEYDDETCCYPVTVSCTYAPLGFGCSTVSPSMASTARLR